MPSFAAFPHRFLKRLALAGSFACLLLQAAMPAAHAAPAYPKAIKDAVANGVKVVKTFPAASGLTGWVLLQDGTYSMAFTTPDRKTLILGTLIGEKGENLTDRYTEKHFPKPDRAALFKQMEQAAYVVEGTAKDPKSVVYIFVEANCTHCNYLWRALQPYEKAGLQARWILVATREPGSMQKAIEVLAASDRTAAFRKMEENAEKNGTPAPGMNEAAKPEIAKKIRKNTELMERFGIDDAPLMVWKDPAGKVQLKGSMPRLSEIPHITGLPQQDIHDPELAKFK